MPKCSSFFLATNTASYDKYKDDLEEDHTGECTQDCSCFAGELDRFLQLLLHNIVWYLAVLIHTAFSGRLDFLDFLRVGLKTRASNYGEDNAG